MAAEPSSSGCSGEIAACTEGVHSSPGWQRRLAWMQEPAAAAASQHSFLAHKRGHCGMLPTTTAADLYAPYRASSFPRTAAARATARTVWRLVLAASATEPWGRGSAVLVWYSGDSGGGARIDSQQYTRGRRGQH